MLQKVYSVQPDNAESLILGALDENRPMTRATAQALYRRLTKAESAPSKKTKEQVPAEDGNSSPATVSVPKGKEPKKPVQPQVGTKVEQTEKLEKVEVESTGIAQVSDAIAGKVRAVSEGLRFSVEVLLEQAGGVSGYLTPDIVAKEDGKICVSLENGEVLIVPIDEVQLTGVRLLSEV